MSSRFVKRRPASSKYNVPEDLLTDVLRQLSPRVGSMLLALEEANGRGLENDLEQLALKYENVDLHQDRDPTRRDRTVHDHYSGALERLASKGFAKRVGKEWWITPKGWTEGLGREDDVPQPLTLFGGIE